GVLLRLDVVADQAFQSANLRRRAILRYAPWTVVRLPLDSSPLNQFPDPTSAQIFSYRFACTAAAIRLTASITVPGRSSWTSWPLSCATIKLPCGERAASCCWSRIKVGSHSLK